MIVYPSSRSQTERTIATARVVLAISSLFAVWMDPAEPSRYVGLTYSLHWAYVGYALALTFITWRWNPGSSMPLVTHVTDIVASSVFQYLTLGPSSPFFIYFVFSMFCAAVRWGWRGTLVTSGIVMTTYLLMTTWMSQTLGAAEFELNRIIVRTVYLLVAASMLVYLGRYEERLRNEIERLARWPSVAGGGTERATARILEYAARILGARRVVLVWEAGDEPTLTLASWSDGSLSLTAHSPADLTPIVPDVLEHATFFSTGTVGADSHVLVSDPAGRLLDRQGLPFHPSIVSLLGGSGLTSAAFHTERVAGRVVFADLGTPTSEIVPLTDVVAREIGTSLDQMCATQQLQEIAAREERIRLARDLHDGVLQSLTGIRFELSAVGSTLHQSDAVARDRLVALERALSIEQRELRRFIDSLRPTSRAPAGEVSLAIRLDALRERLALEWKTPVTITVSPAAQRFSSELAQSVPLMVHEAVVNALKHAQPTCVTVDVDATTDHLRILVVDDGLGFSFKGRYDHAALDAAGTAPRSLFDRVTALGGEMSIDSSNEGSRVEMIVAL